jgi:hypothetical protein
LVPVTDAKVILRFKAIYIIEMLNVNTIHLSSMKMILSSSFNDIVRNRRYMHFFLPKTSFYRFSACLSWYCLSLGTEAVSVNVYLTMLLMNFADFPADLITAVLISRYPC